MLRDFVSARLLLAFELYFDLLLGYRLLRLLVGFVGVARRRDQIFLGSGAPVLDLMPGPLQVVGLLTIQGKVFANVLSEL